MPSITLADALALTPESLPVRLLKMDAQGSDLTIVKATPTESLRRVQLIAMELHSPPRLWKLEGPPDRAKNVMCPQDHGHFCEIQAYFSNTRATVPPPDLEQHPELLFP